MVRTLARDDPRIGRPVPANSRRAHLISHSPTADSDLLMPRAFDGAVAAARDAGHPSPYGLGPAGFTVDDMDRVLIDHVLADVKMTNRDLAQATGLSESAISIRLRKLTTNRILIFTAVMDWEAIGFDWFAIARVKTRGASPKQVAAEIAALKQCDAVSVALGTHDLVAYFLLRDRAELDALMNDDLSQIRGIAEITVDLATSTAVTDNGRRYFLAKQASPIRLPAPIIDLDELDLAILQALIDDGRQSSRKIARTHDVSEGTVRARINRVNQAGLARVTAMVDPVAIGLAGVIACVSLKVDRTRVAAIKTAILAMPETSSFAITVGMSDISLTITAQSHAHLVDFVSTELHSLDGVWDTDTLVMVDVVKFSPYIKRLT